MNERPVALVVGGGSGIGADAARQLAADGYHVGVMRSSGKGEQLGEELGGLGSTGQGQIGGDFCSRSGSELRIKA